MLLLEVFVGILRGDTQNPLEFSGLCRGSSGLGTSWDASGAACCSLLHRIDECSRLELTPSS